MSVAYSHKTRYALHAKRTLCCLFVLNVYSISRQAARPTRKGVRLAVVALLAVALTVALAQNAK